MIAAAAIFTGSFANAQDIYKQTGGEQNIEFLFAPLGGSPIGINGIRYRKFTSATTAYRAEVFLGYNSQTTISTGNGSDGNIDLKTTNSEFDISIAPGIERHFPGTDRLSPYVGGVVLVGFGRSGTSREAIVLNTAEDIETLKASNGSITFGANAVCGMDYYFADNIYIGAELGFGIAFTSELDSKSDAIVYRVDGYDVVTSEVPNGSSFGIGPNVVAQIRVGFLF